MRPLAYSLMLCLALLLTSCAPTPSPPLPIVAPEVAPAPPPVIELNTGPYWQRSTPEATLADAMAYYATLKTLSNDDLSREHKRLLEVMQSTPDHRVPALQLVLLAFLPGQALVAPDQSIKLLETARRDTELQQKMAGLFLLLGDQLYSHVTVRAQSKQGSQTLRSTRKKLSTQAEDLTVCRQERDELAEDLSACLGERDDLAGKLQKLQNIERDLIDRERKK